MLYKPECLKAESSRFYRGGCPFDERKEAVLKSAISWTAQPDRYQ